MKFLRHIFVLVTIASTVNLFGQNISGSYEYKSLAFVLDDIAHRYEVSFAYDSEILASIIGSWQMESEPLEEVLNGLLKNAGMRWKRVAETIVIYSQEEEGSTIPKPTDTINTVPYGEVRDKSTNELLPFAVIVTKSGKHFTSTDSDGKFALNRQMESDTLIVHYVGYEPNEFVPNKATKYNKILMTQRANSLPTIVIESSSVKLVESAPFPSIQTINPNNIAGIVGGGERDIFRAVQMLPGVAGTLESNNGLFVRGSNSDQTLITFDGFTLYQQDHFFGAFSAVNSSAVKNMRIYKGTMDARFGGRVAGVLEIIGNEGTHKDTKAQLEVGPLSIAGLVETTLDKEEKASVLIAGRRSFTNTVFSPTYRSMFNSVYNAAVNVGSDNNLQTFGSSGDPEFYFQDLNVKFTYRASEKDVVNLSFFASKDKLFMQYADTTNFEVVNLRDVNYTDETTKRNVGSGLRWVHRWQNGWESLVSMGFSRFSGQYFSVDSILEIGFQDTTTAFYSENAELDDLDIRWEMNYIGRAHRFQTGIQFNQVATNSSVLLMGVPQPEQLQQGGIFSLYAQDEFDWRERSTFRIGLRANYFSQLKRIDPEPRVSYVFKAIPKRLQLKASAGIIHQYIHRLREQSIYLNTPDYWQFSGQQGIPVLRSLQYALGTVLSYKSWIVDLEGYIKQNSGLFVNTGVYGRTDSARYQSQILTGNGTTYGADFMLQRDWKRQHGWVCYSLIYSQNQFEDAEGWRTIREPFMRQHEAKLYYEFRPKRWMFSALWVIGSGKPYTPYLGEYNVSLPNGAQRTLPVFGDLNTGLLRPYHRLDISAAYTFMLKKIQGKLQFSVFNVYNHQNVRDIQYIAVRVGNENNDYTVKERNINMLPFLPSVNLQLRF